MKKLILMGGDLASGKSTFANMLGEELGILVINKDNLKEILGDTIKVTTREENKKLSVISFDLMCYLLKKNQKDTIILESNFILFPPSSSDEETSFGIFIFCGI